MIGKGDRRVDDTFPVSPTLGKPSVNKARHSL